METAPIGYVKMEPNTNKVKGKKIGTAAGFTAGAGYLAKTGKDAFINASKESLEKLGSKKPGIAIQCAVYAGIIGIAVAGARVIGGAIGSAIDKMHQHKTEEVYK